MAVRIKRRELELKAKEAAFVAVVSLLLASQAVFLSTAVSSGIPSQAVGLALTIIPPKLPADNGIYPAVVVSLVDSNGLPSVALSSLTVFLTSDQTNIAQVPITITIPTGSEYVVANATTTPTPGSATITASSHGLASSHAQLTTVTPSGFPSILKIFVSPSTLLKRADTGTVRVELLDGAGSPSKAITPVTVHLSSSNVSIAGLVQNSLTINSGDIYATGTFHSTSNSGQAVITASVTGYASGGAIVTVVPPNYCSSSCGPSELLLKLVPGTLPTDGKTYSALEIGLATSGGQPAVSASDTIVQLDSDTPDVVSVPDFVVIPAGSISVLAPLTTSSLQGHSSITAVSSSLLPSNLSVRTVIPAPSALQAYIAPSSTFVTSVDNSPILVIQLQDSNGNPARARAVTDITVTSTNNSMVSGPIHMSIGVGLDYVSTHLTVSGSGQCVLTASSQGLGSSNVGLQLATTSATTTVTATEPATTTTTIISTETFYSTVTSGVTSATTVISPTTIVTTTASPTTTTVTTTTNASTFAYVTLSAAVVVILTVAVLAAWVLRGRRT